MPKSELEGNRSGNLTNATRPENKIKQTKQENREVNTEKRKQQNAIICRKHNNPSRNFERLN